MLEQRHRVGADLPVQRDGGENGIEIRPEET
jgi:hypothetical protein